MRGVVQIELTSTRIYAVCDDGTLWRAELFKDKEPEWEPMLRPPDGHPDPIPVLTLEEQAEKIAQSGGRQMIIGKEKV